MASKEPKLRIYRVTFHQNNWGSCPPPTKTLKFKDDNDARAHAHSRIRNNCREKDIVSVIRIVEIVHPEVTRRVRLTREVYPSLGTFDEATMSGAT